MSTVTINRDLFTVPQAAEFLTVGRTTVYAMLASGELPRVKIRRAVRIRREDLERIAREGTAEL